jgi:hypothetical protein
LRGNKTFDCLVYLAPLGSLAEGADQSRNADQSASSQKDLIDTFYHWLAGRWTLPPFSHSGRTLHLLVLSIRSFFHSFQLLCSSSPLFISFMISRR